MKKLDATVAIIGAGPAGLVAACAAKDAGAEKVLIIERDRCSGGILQQCIHAGFGLSYYGEELTGPEYAERFFNKATAKKVNFLFNVTVIEIRDKKLVCSGEEGIIYVEFGALILAMGCREKTRGNLVIPGTRPAGIFTAGTAQRLVNINGLHIGNEIVILGSGDIGMIMARRMSLEGAKVKCAIEIQPKLSGLMRNKVQCLDDFDIPLMLSNTVISINGKDRVESVSIAPVDKNYEPDMNKQQIIECDTVLISAGLIPENELTKAFGIVLSPLTGGPVVNEFYQTEVPYIFACGNVLHVTGLVDDVTRESEKAGGFAALYARKELV